MSGTPAERAHSVAISPRRYSYDEICDELERMHEDADKCGFVLGSWRDRRLDILLRLLVLFETRKPQIMQAMRATLEDLGDQPRQYRSSQRK
jgi:hypothetical protein